MKTDQKAAEYLDYKKRSLIVAGIILAAILLVFIFVIIASSLISHRTESYNDIEGAAGLSATIDYDCGDSCDNKFGFNIYVYTDDGRQMNVVQPNSDGQVKLALPEGNYVMLVGKQFGDDNIFPQEPLELKNGKELELKLQYK